MPANDAMMLFKATRYPDPDIRLPFSVCLHSGRRPTGVNVEEDDVGS